MERGFLLEKGFFSFFRKIRFPQKTKTLESHPESGSWAWRDGNRTDVTPGPALFKQRSRAVS